MSGIYIKGMEMPKTESEVLIIAIESDGSVFPVRIDGEGHPMIFPNEEMKNHAVTVPEHGDLIDLKSPFEAQYYDEMTEEWSEKTVTVEDVLYGCMVSEMPPVVIPADRADKEGEG